MTFPNMRLAPVIPDFDVAQPRPIYMHPFEDHRLTIKSFGRKSPELCIEICLAGTPGHVVQLFTVPCIQCLYSAFSACLRRFGDVVAFFSMSAAHKAAPTVFVKAKISEANGTILHGAYN
jgi:hypothetical protein